MSLQKLAVKAIWDGFKYRKITSEQIKALSDDVFDLFLANDCQQKYHLLVSLFDGSSNRGRTNMCVAKYRDLSCHLRELVSWSLDQMESEIIKSGPLTSNEISEIKSYRSKIPEMCIENGMEFFSHWMETQIWHGREGRCNPYSLIFRITAKDGELGSLEVSLPSGIGYD